ncbi:MAG TPA: hypothetical protein VEC14_10055, partial [Reyranellaceae bacterium]|nr:hypothetical protein [Reyranellaceae bacterium]
PDRTRTEAASGDVWEFIEKVAGAKYSDSNSKNRVIIDAMARAARALLPSRSALPTPPTREQVVDWPQAFYRYADLWHRIQMMPDEETPELIAACDKRDAFMAAVRIGVPSRINAAIRSLAHPKGGGGL